MSAIPATVTSEMAILRRIVNPQRPFLSNEAARAVLEFKFGAADRRRIDDLAAKNREGAISREEEEELTNYLRVGQTLGILQSKARRTLGRERKPAASTKRR
jgi:hypothetical protein